jgi:sodium/hydrogen antiporter
MDQYFVVLVVLGSAMLGMAWIPTLTKKLKVSYSILYLFLGIGLYSLSDVLPLPNPMVHENTALRITELIVIVSLMGTGLKIDEPFSLKGWRIPLRLISITMLLTIALVAVLAYMLLGFDVASSILIGAVLAPTDPVLADDVQVGPPMEKTTNKVRFALTAEAGLNDGMAFPFTWLAISVALQGVNNESLVNWLSYDLGYRILAGLVVGFVFGKMLGYLVFTLPRKKKFLVSRDGFVAISTTILVYGVTELLHGYGFVAVFICAITIRNYEIEHKFHLKLHSFTDQIERMLMAMVLILFGGTLHHYVFSNITWPAVVFAVLIVLVIRPVTAYFSSLGSDLHFKERAAISFYGIKGIGSFFYLSFALIQARFTHTEELWVTVSLVVLLSILIHGLSANSIMQRIEEQFSEVRRD